MRVFIPDDVIIDGDVPVPLVGAVLPAMGLALAPKGTAADIGDSFVTGTVTWSRLDPRADLVEAVIEAEGFAVLTQTKSTGEAVPAVGSTMSAHGALRCIRPYEFEAFQLPDVSRSWRVLEVFKSNTDGYVVNLDPVEFRHS